MKRLLSVLLILLFLALVLPTMIILSQPYQELKTIYDIQRDGTIVVTHVLNVTQNVVSIAIPTYVKPLEPVTAYSTKDAYATEIKLINGTYYVVVYAPDLGIINVTYVTDSLTRKTEPNIWIVSINATAETIVLLPYQAIPIKIPSFIDLYEQNGRYVIILAPGSYEIDYILKVKVPKFIPRISILNVSIPSKVKSGEKLGVVLNVKNIGNASATFFVKIYDVETGKILNSTNVILEPGISQTIKLIIQTPQVGQQKTWYLRVICGHDNVIDDKKELTLTIYVSKPFFMSMWFFIIIAIIIIVIIGIIIKVSRRSKIEEIKPSLSEVDYMIINYLKKKKSAYQSEISQALKLPKTTVWRHLRKLEKYGIIKIERYGNVNIVRLVG